MAIKNSFFKREIMKEIHQDKIIIVDFGSQYTQLIGRRVRELGVYCEIHPLTVDAKTIEKLAPKGIILSGGPASVRINTAPKLPSWVFELNVPVLGICYGMQAMANSLGGEVELATKHEYGYAQLSVDEKCDLFAGITSTNIEAGLNVWMSHGDHVLTLPEGFQVAAKSANTPIAAMWNKKQHRYGVQFHPEVTHTEDGQAILSQFVHKICQCEALWQPGNIVAEISLAVQAKVGQDKVLLGLSGGVDSSVVAALLHQAIGQQLICVFVDTGLLRLGEVEQVQTAFQNQLGIQLITVDAQATFMDALQGIECPEEKRKVIGRVFIDVFEQKAKQLKDVAWLAQGTIYPDVIESSAASGDSSVIKSHHNVGGLPARLPFQLLEPLRELFKDEVRKIGLTLGLPYDLVYRHPFPGPGLGVRILGQVQKAYAEKLRLADKIFIDALLEAELYHKVSQAFAVFLPVKSVGVTGDERRYEHVIALRAVETIDFMTARWAHLPHEFLDTVSNRIINEVPGISRVVYDISGKPPATIEWE
jgi:GMP synthase (glutamine-hydrolysing)